MNKCPRCGKEQLLDEEALNSLSRRRPVYICNECGDEEAMIDSGYMEPTKNDLRFTQK